MKLLLILTILMISMAALSQQSDFFLLKRSGKTIRSFFQGSYIDLVTRDGENYSGYIKKIARDSVWVEYHEILKGYSAFGGVVLDTMTFEARRFAMNNILSIHKEEQRLEQAAPAVLLKIGSAGYLSLHIINGLIQHQSISLKKVGIAAGAYLAGVLISKLHKENYYIGKRYRLQYISL
jgi:hypothetical protein